MTKCSRLTEYCHLHCAPCQRALRSLSGCSTRMLFGTGSTSPSVLNPLSVQKSASGAVPTAAARSSRGW